MTPEAPPHRWLSRPPLHARAELTYRFRCAACTAPTPSTSRANGDGLDTEDWRRIFRQARSWVSSSLNLTGGEPLLAPRLERLVRPPAPSIVYTNLITSGIPR